MARCKINGYFLFFKMKYKMPISINWFQMTRGIIYELSFFPNTLGLAIIEYSTSHCYIVNLYD